MKHKIWVTKNWEGSCCIMIWFVKPKWFSNKKKPCEKDSGYWGNKNGELKDGHPLSYDAFKNLFKVMFNKKANEGFIAERIINVRRNNNRRKKYAS